MSSSGSISCAVVVLAAGEGRRAAAGRNKVLLDLGGVPVVVWSLRRALAWSSRVVVVVRGEDEPEVRAVVAEHLAEHRDLVEVVVGGATRHASEQAAFDVLADDVGAGRFDVVVVHDAARPLARLDLWGEVVRTAQQHGGAVPGVGRAALLPASAPDVAGLGPLHPSVLPAPPQAGAHHRAQPQPGLVAVQTPQAFRAAPLLDAYQRAAVDGFEGTDTAACVRAHPPRGAFAVVLVPGSETNLKVTFPGDLATAERLLR